MLASLSDKPFNDSQWIFEIKWDGYRAISEVRDGNGSIYSRNGILLNEKFPDVVKSLERMQIGSAVFDGELIVPDSGGKSKFSLLQQYLKTGLGNPVYYIFDLLYLDGYDLTGTGLEARKEILKKIIEENEYIKSGVIKNIKFNGHIEKNGVDFFNAAFKNNLEGIIAKKRSSIYEPGTRSKNWLKIKIRQSQEFIICGYTEPDKTADRLGSLVTCAYSKGALIFTGLVGNGLDEKEKKDLYAKLIEIGSGKAHLKIVPKISSVVHWVKPVYVVQVEFAEWTHEGLLRQPVYNGLRIDKSASEVMLNNEEVFKNVTPGEGTGVSGKYLDVKTSGVKVKLTNPEKIFWPEENITKEDLFNYYIKISPYILPYIEERLQSLNRCPDGIYGECFYQKDIDYKLPEGIKTKKVFSESRKDYIDYLVCTGFESLMYMVNLGCIDIHPWSSKAAALDRPDFAIIDLDPLGVPFSEVIKVALVVKRISDDLEIKTYCKTSGSKGIHIYIPMGAVYTFEIVLDFIKIIARIINSIVPDITSLERQPEKRSGRVYIDCFQNKIGATVAAPYCIRPREGAPVSAPLNWEELSGNPAISDFNMKNIFFRLERIGDIWSGLLGSRTDISSVIKKIQHKYGKIFI